MRHALLTAYRLRGFALALAVIPLLANAFASFFPLAPWLQPARSIVALCALALFALSLLIAAVGPRFLPTRDTVTVASPVRGRWLGMNSPASKIPSHGVRIYGQAYAIDLVAEPLDAQRPTFGDGPLMRPADDYPAFGAPVLAMIDGTVVRATDWRRDHRARSHWTAVLYMLAEGAIRELGGPGFVIGNHVTIRGADGSFAVVAHLQRGSLCVRVGDTVRAGQRIGACGNSGNSSEPHVHAQLMDRVSPLTGQGIPLAFAAVLLGADPAVTTGLPANDEHMTA